LTAASTWYRNIASHAQSQEQVVAPIAQVPRPLSAFRAIGENQARLILKVPGDEILIRGFSWSFKQRHNWRIFPMSTVGPMLGIWKLNIGKPKISIAMLAAIKQSGPKEQTNRIRELGADQFELAIVRTRVDGSFTSFKATFPRQGGISKPSPPLAEGTSCIVTMLDPDNWFFTTLQNGKPVRVPNVIIGKDGKTVRETTRGRDARASPTNKYKSSTGNRPRARRLYLVDCSSWLFDRHCCHHCSDVPGLK
jgi:hypothetical protein